MAGKRQKRQEMAIAALLTEKTAAEAAKAAGISETTLYRWLHNEEFQDAYSDAKNAIVRSATLKMRNGMRQGVATLQEICHDIYAPPAARVTAARTLVEFALRANEQENIENRIRKLEKAAAENEIQ